MTLSTPLPVKKNGKIYHEQSDSLSKSRQHFLGQIDQLQTDFFVKSSIMNRCFRVRSGFGLFTVGALLSLSFFMMSMSALCRSDRVTHTFPTDSGAIIISPWRKKLLIPQIKRVRSQASEKSAPEKIRGGTVLSRLTLPRCDRRF